ncbi:UNKNOWN [Stylonychia lemnae]|uniref:RING-type E3 ubiquitin transferase n=1 Tax=Stylonychia lemnae TaxID=5949 RepID=A0A078BBQ5_STYLE|nr:UNKNOWN [Stylonychia lemnae]|eukprot:CDW91819.1 UNKNOWN [Stylonychia lemnae]
MFISSEEAIILSIPLNLKLTIEEQVIDAQGKFDYDKENECCLCKCELYDDLKSLNMEIAIKNQQNLISSVQKGSSEILVVRLGQCQGMHFYHKECIEMQLKQSPEDNPFIKCAVCNKIYGKQVGDMPSGTMSWHSKSFRSCPLGGFTEEQSPHVIIIQYNIPSGRNKDGTQFHGTSRVAYLPGNIEGIKILTLLAEAFRRKLTFKVGTSITTGASNCVVWQGIHHKTSPTGGTSSFGYPDPTYFERVTDELKGRNVTLDQLTKPEDIKSGYIQV